MIYKNRSSHNPRFLMTLSTARDLRIFGHLKENKIIINVHGAIIKYQWGLLRHKYPQISLPFLKLMPSYMHGIVELNEYDFDKLSLNEILKEFKDITMQLLRISGVNNFLWKTMKVANIKSNISFDECCKKLEKIESDYIKSYQTTRLKPSILSF